ncbi:hypothetical protein N9L92_05170 [Saprospiraceae bacterium]|nr:hypothetical protein [Saprospiraceae bacterium]
MVKRELITVALSFFVVLTLAAIIAITAYTINNSIQQGPQKIAAII